MAAPRHKAWRKNGMETIWRTATCCAIKSKGTDRSSIDPQSGTITNLFTLGAIAGHFRLTGGRIQPLTPMGLATVYLVKLNLAPRIAECEQLVKLGLRIPAAE